MSAQTDGAIEKRYQVARETYAEYEVNTDEALASLREVALSLHCWQGDDVGGFENPEGDLGGGLAATGNYPGKARTADELRADLQQTYALLPGKHRLSLHAFYVTQPVERDALEPEHFADWMDWAESEGVHLDFNQTFFSHPLADDGFTLAHPDASVREFWVRHGIACRKVAAAMGERQGSPCICNVWIPDGMKDEPADRWTPRQRLRESLDAMFAPQFDRKHLLDSVESKLFGIGSESYVVGSHEFYLAYALTAGTLLCLDTGHFHPTESIADKLSSVLTFIDEILLHVSRGIRWDSDHVVTLRDEPRAIMAELVRGQMLDRVHIGLDFFDASINRIAAWVVGARATLKALLIALLQPVHRLQQLEADGDFTGRLALMEELKTLPASAVWDYHCLQSDAPAGLDWLEEVRKYEREVLAERE